MFRLAAFDVRKLHLRSVAAEADARRVGLVPCGLITLLAFLLFLTGCGTGKGMASGDGRIEQLHLVGTPVALDVDNKPGADGLGVRIYASNNREPEAVRISSGKLDIMVYDGVAQAIARLGTNAVPLVTSSYAAQELRKIEHKTAVGISYNFVPLWGENKPAKGRVTVVARYTAPDGRIVRSGPITVPLAVK
jgi:hypothetical protein